ncbi:hypothetical protein acsn021_11490 [Anaerocolumna cellulosilytica]|uniref:Uncharacterized protein n=1 Tax=Anaerocolumna cellulosilytica TaxID=433286 RepID=A0A6S6R2N3_9FIRM|nr:DUF6339 family protein [Anaerocolumna cellulosilytica]MBB5194635.1 hypothetical protein [Anaerocolumna cellulosilytica]BCJ93580.1 hypothetical protein acsn021_11490 [Anaerocolumna cellulosilytica]
MKIQIIGTEKLIFLKDKACIEGCLNKYQNYSSNDWLEDICDGSPFVDTKFQNINDFTLDMSADISKAFETEFENVKRVYSKLKFLTDSMASDERLWAGLCLGHFFEYVRYRWDVSSVSGVLQHFYFDGPKRRALTRNAISRLWWIGRLTYDENRANKWELTEFVCSYSDYIMHFIERNTSNNLHVMRPFLEAMIEARKGGYALNTDDAGKLAKYLNLLGGMYVLDFMPEEWIKEKIRNKITMMIKQSVTEIKDEEVNQIVEEGKIVTRNSKIVIENLKTRQKILIMAKKNKLITKPVNLSGLVMGDKIYIGKESFIIKDIR